MSNIMNKVNGKPIEDASAIANAVRYDVEQIRNEEEKALARQNIGCFCEAGGGGGGSSGGETLVVEIEPTDTGAKFNKTAKEVFDACKTSNVVFVETKTVTDPQIGLITVTEIHGLHGIEYKTDGQHSLYLFYLTEANTTSTNTYSCAGDNNYPEYNR